MLFLPLVFFRLLRSSEINYNDLMTSMDFVMHGLVAGSP